MGSETTEGATGGGGALQAARQITSAPPGVDKLAGPELLQHIRNVHPRHEAMVQTSLQRETIPTNLLEHVRLIQRAVVSYATRVCGTVEKDDDTTAETARDALAAIEKMRLTAANKRGGAAEPDAPAEVPTEPAAPVVEAPMC